MSSQACRRGGAIVYWLDVELHHYRGLSKHILRGSVMPETAHATMPQITFGPHAVSRLILG
ncbi:MAG TPA: hypothetical protein VM366_11100, partial [Anaerolineae bacterium]|nr:hypothetical protein [Anaerolineae bacterium]